MPVTQPRGVHGTCARIIVATLAVLGLASQAPALIISGGPTYTLPGGGSCSVSGTTGATGGATLTCTGVNLAAHTKVYFGIRNSSVVNANSMTGSPSTAGSPEVFRFASNTGTSITYTSTTTVNDVVSGGLNVNQQLILTLTSGSATVVAAGGNPGNNSNGDINALFQVNSASFSVRADIKGSFTLSGYTQALPGIYDPTRTASGAGADDFSRVDVAFYYSDCGDGVIDSPEVCDQGVANGTTGSCCTSSCTYRAAGQVCRPGPGAPCDVSETCTGSAAVCPSDDATLHAGLVCRAGSGDACDTNETCTGAPGQGCPADDAPTNAGVVCRVGSVGDICNEDEVCTGTPGATCPADDAPTKINLVCRAGSGDVCDPDERCTGNPGQGCPADVVANPSTVCRVGSGDMCDPNETCTAVPGQPCPANVVTSAGTMCRAAAGQCDVAENCTGSAGQTCPGNGFAAANTPCDADSSVCTTDKCDGSNHCNFVSNIVCEDGNVCTQDSCDPQDGCVAVGQPSTSCTSASKAMLRIKDSTTDTKDGLKFLWKGGPALAIDMGNPTQTTRYELCIYDSTGVQAAMGVDGGTGWSFVGSSGNPKGYKYLDIAAQQDGIKTIKTKASSLDKGKLLVLGKGAQLPDTAWLPFQFPVTAQVYASDGMCWEAQFTAGQAKKNEPGAFSAKK
ncbi:MAG: hypothetical protein SF182_12435 [Deltaproteobacteria bacterium]|nr:hypothetical protein [Deltaproteobacteria bacterium]